MTKNLKAIIGVVVVVAVILVGYVSFKNDRSKENTGTIKIGVSAPLTGEAASWGEAIMGGAQLATKEVNDKGGINGRLIALVFEDDKCSKDGFSAVSKLVNVDKVTAIVGPACSSVAGPSVPMIQNAGIPNILIASAPELTKIGDYIFRIYPSDNYQAQFASEYIFKNLNKRKAAIVYIKNDWGQGVRNVFVEKFKQQGGEIVFDEGVLPDAKDLRSIITKLKGSNPDVVYFPVYPSVVITGLRQMKELNLKVLVVGADGFEADEVFKSGVAEGSIYTAASFSNPEEFQKRVKDATGKNSNFVSPVAYDAVNIFAEIMKKAGTDQKVIRDELVKLSYTKGVSSSLIEFDKNGDIKQVKTEVKIIKNGKAEIYRP